MEIYLDESGDMGFDFEFSSPSCYFVITLLICQNRNSVFGVQIAVRNTLKHKLNYSCKNIHHELKATKVSVSIKQYFYRNALKYDGWLISSIIFDKLSLFFTHKKQLPSTHRIYNYLSSEALKLVNFSEVRTIRIRINSLLKKYQIPGASIAVIKNGKILWAKGFGYEDLGTKRRVDENTKRIFV